jgi:hypothetical protein
VTFEFTDQGLQTGLATAGRQMGLIAQDVESVLPEWVDESPNGYKYITERGMTALTVESMREIEAKVRAHDAEIVAKEKQIVQLQERVRHVEETLARLTNNGGGL